MNSPDPDTLLDETRAFNDALERMLATIPPVNTVPPEESRRARREGRGIFPAPVYVPEARTIEIEGPRGPISLRIIAPEDEPKGTFLHLHGGGWTLGESDAQDLRLRRLARETGLAAVSVNYRLAPENPYPAGPDDCEAAALWLIGAEGRALLAAPEPRAIGGDSAGGQLGCGDSSAPTRPPRDHRRVRRRGAPIRLLRPVDDAEPAAVGGPEPRLVGADHRLVRRAIPPSA